MPAMPLTTPAWATSQWLFRKDTGAEAKLDTRSPKPGPIVSAAERLTTADTAEMRCQGTRVRSMHSHGGGSTAWSRERSTMSRHYHVRGAMLIRAGNGWKLRHGHPRTTCRLGGGSGARGFAGGEMRCGNATRTHAAHIQRSHYRIYDDATRIYLC